ncbi:MAG: aminotransferase class V-fold PLP-dependent enzyme [Nitriliruptoraceae bacterium]
MDHARNLDHASVWPIRPQALAAYQDAANLGSGDPERLHTPGRRARDLLMRASETVGQVVGVDPDDVVWTSGGTESTNLAVVGPVHAARRAGSSRRRLVVSAVEHSSVLRTARALERDGDVQVDVAPVDRSGIVDVDAIRRLVGPDTLVVHVQHANHEVGAVQPTDEVARIAHEQGAVLHVDACQSVGQLGFTATHLGADLVSASSAKFGGPVGVGFLALGPSARIAAMLEGDDRQRRRRAGQVDVAAIAAAAVALRVATDDLAAEHSARELVRRHLRARLTEVPDVQVHGPLADAHPGIVAVSALYVDGAALTAELDARGFAVHSGSSCATSDQQPSHVLAAMEALTHGHVRLSFGPQTTREVADEFLEAYRDIVATLRDQSNHGRRRAHTATIDGPPPGT